MPGNSWSHTGPISAGSGVSRGMATNGPPDSTLRVSSDSTRSRRRCLQGRQRTFGHVRRGVLNIRANKVRSVSMVRRRDPEKKGLRRSRARTPHARTRRALNVRTVGQHGTMLAREYASHDEKRARKNDESDNGQARSFVSNGGSHFFSPSHFALQGVTP